MRIRTLGKIDIALILIVVVISSIIVGAVYFLDRVENGDEEKRRAAAEELDVLRNSEARDRQVQIDELGLDSEQEKTSQGGRQPEGAYKDTIDIELVGNDQIRMRDLTVMAEELNRYRGLEGFYPETFEGDLLDISVESPPCAELIAAGILASCPKDPGADGRTYRYRSNGDTYELTALLDNRESGDCQIFEDICIYSIAGE